MSVSSKYVLACVDASPYMRSVCGYASWLASSLALPVRLMHVRAPFQHWMNASPYPDGAAPVLTSELMEELVQLERSHTQLELQRSNVVAQQAEAFLAPSRVLVEVTQPVGSLVDAVSELAEETSVIVIGKRGEQAGYATGHLGSNLERVVRGAQAPVLVAAVEYEPVKRIAIAYDGGANANLALDYIVTHPMFAGVECHIIGAGPAHARHELHLAKAAGILAQSHHPVHVHYEDGLAEDVLGNYIVQHDIHMLLMGAYSHSALRNLFIGSTTNAMLQSCPVSVMLFR